MRWLKISKRPNGGDALKSFTYSCTEDSGDLHSLRQVSTFFPFFSTDFAISTNAGLRYPVTETPRAFKYCFKPEAKFSQNDCAPKYYPCFDRILPFFTLPFFVFKK